MKIRQRYRPEKNATDALTKITQPLAKVASASTLLRPTRKLVVGPVVVGPVAHVLVVFVRHVWVGHPQAVPTAVGPRAAAAAGGRYGALRTAAGVAESPRARRASSVHFDLRREVLKPGDDQVLRPSHRPGSAAPTR